MVHSATMCRIAECNGCLLFDSTASSGRLYSETVVTIPSPSVTDPHFILLQFVSRDSSMTPPESEFLLNVGSKLLEFIVQLSIHAFSYGASFLLSV